MISNKREYFRNKVIQGLFYSRKVTAKNRTLPDYLLIGATRSGTTSLWTYLSKHPNILSAFKKEIHFFDFNFSKGVPWYKAHFPLKITKNFSEKIRQNKIITGDATPYYIYHPHAPTRIFDTVPDVKLVALLRNPIDRAYSHYSRNVRRNVESLSFEEAIQKEEERLNGEYEKSLGDEMYYSRNLHAFSYLSQGRYYEQLTKWYEIFPKDQFLILKSENFYENTESIYYELLDFLDIPRFTLNKFEVYNFEKYHEMKDDTREHLRKYFKPYNNKLKTELGIDISWE